MQRIVVIVVFFVSVFKVYPDNSQFRVEYHDARSLGGNWSTVNSIGYVYYNYSFAYGDRYQLRTNYTYKVNEHHGLVGGLFIHYWSQSNLDDYVELRPYLGYKLNLNNSGFVKFKNLLRYEYRSNLSLENKNNSFSKNVIRLRVLALMPLWSSAEKPRSLNVHVGPEFFLATANLSESMVYNKLRTIFGLDYKMMGGFSTSISVVPELNQSNKLNLSDLNTVILFFGIKRTI